MDTLNMPATLLKPKEAARMLNISRSLVYRLIRSGDLPVVRIQSTVRIKTSDLHVFIEKNLNRREYQLPLF